MSKSEYEYFDGDLFETDDESFVCFTPDHSLTVYATAQIHKGRYFIVKISNNNRVIKSCNILYHSAKYSYSTHYKLTKEEGNIVYNLLLQKPESYIGHNYENYSSNWDLLIHEHYELTGDKFYYHMPDYRLLK